MLSAGSRLRRGQDFDLVFRQGVRCGRPRLVVHVLTRQALTPAVERCSDMRTTTPPTPVPTEQPPGPRVGFVVSKAVGGSVVRHRVTRRLRHLLRDRMGRWPSGTDVVVRALPAAGSATSAELARDLDSALRRLGLGG